MKKLKRFLISFFISVICLTLVSASILDIDVDIKKSFSIGEKVFFKYTIISDTNERIIFYPYLDCLSVPLPLIEQQNIELKTDEPYIRKYSVLTITKDIEPQTCTAYVQILSPIQKRVSKNFTIVTDPSFSFDIKLDKKIFLLNEDIYLDYDLDIENPSIIATLIYPDKTSRQITLPTSIKAFQIGTYELEVTASKEGYKTITKKEQFGVIEKQADINVVSEDKTKRNLLIIGLIIMVIIIVILIIFYILFKKRKKK